MKIGIDISQIIYGGGVAVYTENLVNSLLEVDKKNEYKLFFSALRRKAQSLNLPARIATPARIDTSVSGGQSVAGGKTQNYNVKLKTFKIPQTLLDFIWNKLHILPIENFLGDIDVFHASDWTQPPSRKAELVTTIHDLSFLRWPETVDRKVYQVQKRRLEWVKREADHIVAVSEATKQEAIELLGIPEEKIAVIYEALPEDIGKFKINDLRFKNLKEKLKIDKPYIIAYGSQAPRKNIKRLIRAFGKIRGDRGNKGVGDYELVIIGDYQPEEKLPEGVALTGFLPREEMLTLLSGAELMAFPSLYEGFGLIILEAFALGVPVLTSNVSSMPEVAGDAAALVDPSSVDSIREGMIKALDKGNRKEMIERGKKRLNLFSWERTAKETMKVYERSLRV